MSVSKTLKINTKVLIFMAHTETEKKGGSKENEKEV